MNAVVSVGGDASSKKRQKLRYGPMLLGLIQGGIDMKIDVVVCGFVYW